MSQLTQLPIQTNQRWNSTQNPIAQLQSLNIDPQKQGIHENSDWNRSFRKHSWQVIRCAARRKSISRIPKKITASQ